MVLLTQISICCLHTNGMSFLNHFYMTLYLDFLRKYKTKNYNPELKELKFWKSKYRGKMFVCLSVLSDHEIVGVWYEC